MMVLGLHLGHDATACVMSDGHILSVIEKERLVRVKHAGLMNIELIEAALECAGVDIDEIDFVAVTQTQNWPTVFFDRRNFYFEVDCERAHELNAGSTGEQALKNLLKRQKANHSLTVDRFTRLFLNDATKTDGYGSLMTDYFNFGSEHSSVLFSCEFPFFPKAFKEGYSLDTLFKLNSRSAKALLPTNKKRFRYHVPLKIYIHGREIPGAQFPHHLAHAAVAHYQSGKEKTAILTVDNGHSANAFGYTGGLFCAGEGTQMSVLGPNYTFHGHVYNRVGKQLGWTTSAASGKLMGLAPYGKPRFFDPSMLGDYISVFDFDKNTVMDGLETTRPFFEFIISHAKDRNYDPFTPDIKDVLLPISKDIASSTQHFFEEQTAYFANILDVLCQRADFEPEILGMSGGCALNCPANSMLHRIGRFSEIFVPPSVDDSGLALGAAFLTTHDLFDIPRVKYDPYSSTSAYLGRGWSKSQVKAAIAANLSDILIEEPLNAPDQAAKDLANNRIIAWFEGRSEIGPRALGNRSILANPRFKENWRRTNEIKTREHWRPFAPAVLEEKSDEWFEGAPSISPFMLFTAQVKSKSLPAVTHVDGSARVQTVGKKCGGIRKVLESLDQRTGVPVVLNTSFNGPGEPIVDTPQEAINFLITSKIDSLYLQGYKLLRKER